MRDDILCKIRGEDLGRAVLTLPPIESTAAETVRAVVDAAGIGLVRVTFRKFRKRHHRTSLLFWLAERAELTESVDVVARPGRRYLPR